MVVERALSELRLLLDQEPPGPVRPAIWSTTRTLLQQGWTLFSDSTVTRMEPWKTERAIEFVWDPPRLSFKVERHGAVALGSKRAEIQKWQVDLGSRTADQVRVGHRNIAPPEPGLDVKVLVEKVLIAVQAEPQSGETLGSAIKWISADEVWVKPASLIPGQNLAKQTRDGRRNRFRKYLIEAMERGWVWKKSKDAYVKFVRATGS